MGIRGTDGRAPARMIDERSAMRDPSIIAEIYRAAIMSGRLASRGVAGYFYFARDIKTGRFGPADIYRRRFEGRVSAINSAGRN